MTGEQGYIDDERSCFFFLYTVHIPHETLHMVSHHAHLAQAGRGSRCRARKNPPSSSHHAVILAVPLVNLFYTYLTYTLALIRSYHVSALLRSTELNHVKMSMALWPQVPLSQVMSPTCSIYHRTTMASMRSSLTGTTQFFNDSDTQQPDPVENDDEHPRSECTPVLQVHERRVNIDLNSPLT